MDSPESEEGSWKEEAESVIADVRGHVDKVELSTTLPNSCQKIYINLTTLEMNKYCIELTGSGFRIVGNDYDNVEMDDGTIFETPYSLLDSVSPGYRESFGKALERKLNQLNSESENS